MDNLQVVRNYYDTLNRHDAKLAAQCFDPSSEFKSMDTLQVTKGIQPIQEMIQSWFTAFPDMNCQITNLFGSGDYVVCENLIKGTHKGVMKGAKGELPATGKRINVASCDIYKIVNGKFKLVNCYFETITLLEQVGAWQAGARAA